MSLNLTAMVVSFPVILLGELPDKTMFANLILATRGKAVDVWLGSAAAFVVHVAIAVTAGEVLVRLVPTRVVDGIVAGLFFGSAIFAWIGSTREEKELSQKEAARHGAILTAFIVIFLAEWGDLTQVLIANLAARYRAPLSVGIGSTLALWTVTLAAVLGGRLLMQYFDARLVKRIMAVVLLALAIYTVIRGFG